MARRTKTYEVNGFLFFNEETAGKAKKEAEGIKYLKTKTDRENPEVTLQIYNHAVEQELFETPVGIQYLRELQDYLTAIPFIKREDIRPIPVEETLVVERSAGKKRDKSSEEEKKAKPARNVRVTHVNYKKRYHVSFYFNIILLIIVLGMFAVAMISHDNVTIINYENQLINKYEDWEQELEEREQAISEKEAQINGSGQQ